MTISTADGHARNHKLLSVEVERLTNHIETQNPELRDLRALARRSESRIVALGEQVGRSQANLESTSARFNELAGEIPADVANLSGQLSRILHAAIAEADEIRAEADRFGETVRVEAEERATRITAQAQLEYEAAAALRAELEAQSKQMRADIARLREEAALNAAEIVRDAENTAEEILARVHSDVEAQLAVSQAKLDELSQVRANIAAQLTVFYEKFNDLDRAADPVGQARTVFLLSNSHEVGSTCATNGAQTDRHIG